MEIARLYRLLNTEPCPQRREELRAEIRELEAAPIRLERVQ